jgi:outer membrane protein assembly factor BamB
VPNEFRSLVARRSDGATPIWSQTVPERIGEAIYGDLVPIAAAAGTHLAVETIDSSNGQGRAYVFTSRGGRVFATQPLRTVGSGQGMLSALDVNGDRSDDIMFHLASVLHVYSGVDGSILARGLSSYPHMPVGVAGSADPVSVITASANIPVEGVSFPTHEGMMFPRRIESHWATSASAFPAGSFYPCYGAVVQCPDGLRFASSISTTPRFVMLNAATGAVIHDFMLSNGRTYPNEMALRAAVSVPGLLGNVSASRAIDGTRPAFVVGSTDGHLYAVDACAATPTLVWQMNFRAPVGEAIFADPDGDGSDEIIVSSADGLLHLIDTEAFAAPMYVHEIDPPRVTSEDVDEVRGLTLSATWAEVPGATAYEWALYTALGTAVSQREDASTEPFVRTTERRATWGLGLTSGTRYFFAVRAIGPGGSSSVETLSDGVRFVRETPFVDAATDTGAPDGTTLDIGSSDAPVVTADAAISIDALDATPSDAAVVAPPNSAAESGGCGCRAQGTTPAPRFFAWSLLALVCTGRRRSRNLALMGRKEPL